MIDGGVTKGEYTYNGNGQRTKKTVSGTTTVFHYSQSGQIIAESNGSGTIIAEYVYLNSQPLAKIEQTNVYYYVNDHLGTPQKLTDGTGMVVWAADYKPFGEATITVSTITNNLRFPGQYFDAETGLHQNWNRDYNWAHGGYIEADPIGLEQGENHLFVYAKNDPIRNIDLNGLKVYRCKRPLTASDKMSWGSTLLYYIGYGHEFIWVDSIGAGLGLVPKHGYGVFSYGDHVVPGYIKSEGSDQKQYCNKVLTDKPCEEKKYKDTISKEFNKEYVYDIKKSNCIHWVDHIVSVVNGP